MIRFVSTVSLLVLLVLVLYLPSVYPPNRFFDQVRIEHDLNATFWDERHAALILTRMLDFHDIKKQVDPLSPLADAPVPNTGSNPVAFQMTQVTNRFFNNPYFRSIDSLFVLASYRVSALIEWLPVLLVFMAVVLLDGLLIRIIKSKEFLQHNPQIFSLYACATIATSCVTAIAFVLPVTLNPVAIPILPIVLSVFISRAAANFHRRG
jgi:hypothetical protein